MVEGEGFEPSKAMPTDLQSVPVGHLGIPPTHDCCLTGVALLVNHQAQQRGLVFTQWLAYKACNVVKRAASSAVEHYLHTVGVTGSIPVLPTTLLNPSFLIF